MPFKNKAERRAMGLCARCSRKAETGRVLCPVCAEKERNRKPRKQNPETYKNWYYQRRYGITLEAFEAMEKAQGYRCAICGTEKARKQSGKVDDCLHVDHCHTTGKVRGLLCLSCNRAVGLIKDSPEIAERMGAYLTK